MFHWMFNSKMFLQKKSKKCAEGCECKNCGNLTANIEIDEVHVALEELVLHEDNYDADDDELGDWIFMDELQEMDDSDSDSDTN